MLLLSILYKPGITLVAGVESTRHRNAQLSRDCVLTGDQTISKHGRYFWVVINAVVKGLRIKWFRVRSKRGQKV